MKPSLRSKGSVIAALDIGSSKIACFIARTTGEPGGFEVLGAGHQASAGVRNGTVVDLDAAEAAIRQTVHAAENMAASVTSGYPLRDVVVSVAGIHTQSHRFEMGVEIRGHEVTDTDVSRVLAQAQDHALQGGQELMHTIPAGYRIDGQAGVKEPRGMFGQALEADIHLVTGDAVSLRNVATCTGRGHLDIAALCSAPYAAGLATLVEDEMDLGCTVVDMGGGTTSFAVFIGGAMIHCDGIPVGGQHVTSDIARGLTTSLSAAERLKTLYGSAFGAGMDESELIDVPQIGEDRGDISGRGAQGANHVPRSLLVGIIQPRVEEIFELMRARLQDSGVAAAAGRRVILTGGACQLPGLRDLGQVILDKQVRLGRPIRVPNLAEAVSGPAFAAAAGHAELLYRPRRRNARHDHRTGAVGHAVGAGARLAARQLVDIMIMLTSVLRRK